MAQGPKLAVKLTQSDVKVEVLPVALVWDLSKAYHSIHTSEKEKFLRLIW